MAQDVSQVIEQVLASPAVRQALRDRAERMLPRAQREAFQAGAAEFGRALHVEDGVRPGAQAEGGLKRPYARVTADVTDEMRAADAGSKLTRKQILRRSTRV